MCAEGRDLHVVPLQAGVPEVRLALQEGRRPVHPLTQVVVVVTGYSPHADAKRCMLGCFLFSFVVFLFKLLQVRFETCKGRECAGKSRREQDFTTPPPKKSPFPF